MGRYPSQLRLSVAAAGTVLCLYIAVVIAPRITGGGFRNLHDVFSTRAPMQWLFALLGFRRMDAGTVLGTILVGVAAYSMHRILRDILVIDDTPHPALRPETSR